MHDSILSDQQFPLKRYFLITAFKYIWFLKKLISQQLYIFLHHAETTVCVFGQQQKTKFVLLFWLDLSTPRKMNMCYFVSSRCLPQHRVSCRLSVHRLRQSLPELLGHHHFGLLGLPAPTVPVGHGQRHRLPASPDPGLPAPLQPAGHAADAHRSGWNHAGQRAVLPFLPHAPLPPLLPAGALRRHPGTPPLLHGHDALCMTPSWWGDGRSALWHSSSINQLFLHSGSSLLILFVSFPMDFVNSSPAAWGKADDPEKKNRGTSTGHISRSCGLYRHFLDILQTLATSLKNYKTWCKMTKGACLVLALEEQKADPQILNVNSC